MEAVKEFVKIYSQWNCFAQLIFVSLLTIIIITLIRLKFKPKNTNIFEWMSLGVSFLIIVGIDLLIIFNFLHRLDVSVITQEILLIIGTPFFTKLIYDSVKEHIFKFKVFKGGNDNVNRFN